VAEGAAAEADFGRDGGAALVLRVEAALFAAGEPLAFDRLVALCGDGDAVGVRAALATLREVYTGRALELIEVAGGWRFQVRAEHARVVAGLFAERAPRYSRAVLETLAIIAYRQPVTRAEIEALRGVQVTTAIVRTLLDREWVRVAGHRDLPGRPAVYATTRTFLDHFGLRSLAELPPLAEVRSLTDIEPELPLLQAVPDGEAGA
jgi:segregation and condensation protein B